VRATNKLIPELRFPEFVNDREWKIKSINDLCNILNNLRKPISGSDRKKGDYPYYGASGIIDYVDEYIFDERLLLVGEDGAKWNAFENTAFLVEEKYWVNNHAHVLKPIKINDKLLESYLVKLDLQPYITGAVPPKLTLGKLKDIPIPVPENPLEQQKIASCLSSLDEVITAYSQKFDTLKSLKKGLMQNLFPQDGETVPKYRFPEFLKDGDWVEKVLSEVADYENGKAHEKDIDEGGDFVVVNSKFISTEGQTVKYSNSAICLAKNGDILMVLSDLPNGKAIAKCFYVKEDDRYTVNQRICKITPFDCENVFLFYIMNRNSYFLGFDDGVKQTNLRNQDVQNFPFLLPDNPKEQEKIASCLASLDSLISEQGEKIEQLKLHKKGLMQGLFPKIID
jgi:type I restriction enzyme S subunit